MPAAEFSNRTPPRSMRVPVWGTNLNALTVADVNGDGKMDLICANAGDYSDPRINRFDQ